MNVTPNMPVAQFPLETPRPAQSSAPQETARPVEAPHHTEASARKTSRREDTRQDSERQHDERAAANQKVQDQGRLTTVGGLVDTFA
jgi:hypothetical protein